MRMDAGVCDLSKYMTLESEAGTRSAHLFGLQAMMNEGREADAFNVMRQMTQ